MRPSQLRHCRPLADIMFPSDDFGYLGLSQHRQNATDTLWAFHHHKLANADTLCL